jgi:L-threonylcarbamoyladenylate synthase
VSSRLFLDTKEQVRDGISVLKKGGLVAFPTDTVYGLGACFNNLKAVERIYELKQRPLDVALPLLVADVAQMGEVAKMPPVALLLARRFLPGALTLVLTRTEIVPDIITGGGETVAVRIPAHPVPIALIRGVDVPIVGTSANITGQSSALTAGEVVSQFGDKIDLVIDGLCSGGVESTVVDVTGGVVQLLREGAIPREELEQACKVV